MSELVVSNIASKTIYYVHVHQIYISFIKNADNIVYLSIMVQQNI